MATDIRAQVRELSLDIADMVSTAVRIGETQGWDSDLYKAISRDIRKFERKRARLLRQLEKHAA
jgi:hypothetical protein